MLLSEDSLRLQYLMTVMVSGNRPSWILLSYLAGHQAVPSNWLIY